VAARAVAGSGARPEPQSGGRGLSPSLINRSISAHALDERLDRRVNCETTGHTRARGRARGETNSQPPRRRIPSCVAIWRKGDALRSVGQRLRNKGGNTGWERTPLVRAPNVRHATLQRLARLSPARAVALAGISGRPRYPLAEPP
jgi:hypothetical protein